MDGIKAPAPNPLSQTEVSNEKSKYKKCCDCMLACLTRTIALAFIAHDRVSGMTAHRAAMARARAEESPQSVPTTPRSENEIVGEEASDSANDLISNSDATGSDSDDTPPALPTLRRRLSSAIDAGALAPRGDFCHSEGSEDGAPIAAVPRRSSADQAHFDELLKSFRYKQ